MPKTTVSNHILGLVPAFFYSAASSILWPFDDNDMAICTGYCYSDFGSVIELSEGDKRVMDLAMVNHRDVILSGEFCYEWVVVVESWSGLRCAMTSDRGWDTISIRFQFSQEYTFELASYLCS